MVAKLRSIFADHPISFVRARELCAQRGIVSRIIDGDTLDILVDISCGISYYVPVRLLDVYAPELKGATKEAGVRWRDALAALAPVGSFVIVQTFATKRGDVSRTFERWVATVWLANGQSVNDALPDAAKALLREPSETRAVRRRGAIA